MPIVGAHFVCRNDRNVTDHGDGTFDSGFGLASRTHRPTIEYLAHVVEHTGAHAALR